MSSDLLRRDGRRAQQHVRGARRSDPARHPGAARGGRGNRQRAGRAVPDHPAGGLQAPQGARAGRAHRARAQRTAAALATAGRRPRAGRRLAGGLPGVLGGQLRSPRRAPTRDPERDTAMTEAPTAQEITITRVFDAPRELVWKAWTEPDQLAAWWGARGWSTLRSTVTMEVRPGGRFHVTSV